MNIKSIFYEKCFPLGGYSNEKIGTEIIIGPDEDPLDAFATAKKLVEKSHKFFQDLPSYEQAKKMVANPDDHTGRDISRAKEAIEVFEANYPDYLQTFNAPVSRQLTNTDQE